MTTRNTLIAVGGTGAHVAIAYLRMAILSNMAISDVPNIVIVDGDTADANQSEGSLLAEAKKLFSRVVSGSDARSQPRWLPFVPYLVADAQDRSIAANTQFGDFLLAQPRHTAPLEERQILDSLFTRPAERARGDVSEQEVLIRDGFSARPSVGASAMYDLLAASSALALTLREIALDKGSTGVVVVGSSSGGTGSGAGPALAQWLQNEIDKAESQASLAQLGLFMTLPWFYPDNTTSDSAKPPAGTRENQRQNTAAGVRLYKQSRSLAQSSVFLADYFGIQTVRSNDGDARQRENPHPMSLILASQIQNFFISAEQSRGAPSKRQRTEYTFFNQATKEDGQKFCLKAHDSPILAFSRNADVRQDLHNWAVETQSLRLILSELAGFIRRGYKDSASGAQRSRPDAFKKLMLRLARAKFPEVAGDRGVQKVGGVMGVGAALQETAQVREALSAAIVQRVFELSDTIDWFSRVERNSEASGSKTLRIDPNSIKVRLEAADCKYFPIFEKGTDPQPVVTAVFEDSFDNAKTLGTEAPATNCVRFFEQLIDVKAAGGMDPDTAAVYTIERQIRALMQKGQRDTINERKLDAANPALKAGLVAQHLVPLQAGERALNQYLSAIDIAKLVDVSNDRSGARLEPHDPAHPFTVTGIQSRAIPSPWAAAHRQSWERLHGASEVQTLTRQSVEAVMWGLFTKRLLPKRLDIRRTRLGRMLKGSLESELHHSGVTAMSHILVAVDAANPEDVVATNQPAVAWFVAPWLVEEAARQQEAKWWRLPRFGLELPTELAEKTWDKNDFVLRQIRSFVEALKGLRQYHLPDANAARSLDIPWYLDVADLINVLDAKVQGVLPVPRGDSEQMVLFGRDANKQMQYPAVPLPVLSQSLHEILKSYVPTKLVSVETTAGSSPGGVRHPDLPVYSAHVGLVEACNGPSEIGRSSDGQTYTLRYELTLRGLGKARVEVPSHRVSLSAYLGIFPNFKADGWRRYMVGSYQPQMSQDSPKEDFQFTVLTQQGDVIGDARRGFNANHLLDAIPAYVALHANAPPEDETLQGEVGCFSTRLQDLLPSALPFNLGLDIGTSHSTFFPADTTGGAIAGVDFCKCGAQLTEVMFAQTYLQDAVMENSVFLGVHSAKQDGKEKRVLPSELKVQIRTHGVAPADMLVTPEPARHFTILPYEYQDPKAQSRRGALGEYLSDFKWDRSVNGGVYHGLADTNFEDNQSEILGIYLEHMFLLGFAMLRKLGYRKLGVLRATYPEAFNNIQLETYGDVLVSTLRRISDLSGIEAKFKTPNAPGAITVANLKASDLIQPPATLAGALVRRPAPDQSCFVSESLAAISATPLPDGNALRGISLVLDMGGGTTDVALFSFASSHQERASLPPSLTDSIRFAGNDVLAILNTDEVYAHMARELRPGEKIDPNLFKTKDGEDEPQARMAVIKRLMRNPLAVKGLRKAMINGKLPEQIKRVSAFFDGVIAYACTMAKAYQGAFEHADAQVKHWNVNVILLGNGWRLTDLIYDNAASASAAQFLGDISREIQEYLGGTAVQVNAVFNTAAVISVKEAIAYGALNAHLAQPNLQTISAKSFVGGFPLTLVVDASEKYIASDAIFEIGLPQSRMQLPNRLEIDRQKPLLPELIKKRYLSLVMKQANQTEDRELSNLSGNLNNKFIDEITGRSLSPREVIRLSPFGLFLEHYWKQACQK